MTVCASSYCSCVRDWEGVRGVRTAPDSDLDGSLLAEAHSEESHYLGEVLRKYRNHQQLQILSIAIVTKFAD